MKAQVTQLSREDIVKTLGHPTKNLSDLCQTAGFCRLCEQPLYEVLVKHIEYDAIKSGDVSFSNALASSEYFKPALTEYQIRMLKSCLCYNCTHRHKNIRASNKQSKKERQAELLAKLNDPNHIPMISVSHGLTKKQLRARKRL